MDYAIAFLHNVFLLLCSSVGFIEMEAWNSKAIMDLSDNFRTARIKRQAVACVSNCFDIFTEEKQRFNDFGSSEEDMQLICDLYDWGKRCVNGCKRGGFPEAIAIAMRMWKASVGTLHFICETHKIEYIEYIKCVNASNVNETECNSLCHMQNILIDRSNGSSKVDLEYKMNQLCTSHKCKASCMLDQTDDECSKSMKEFSSKMGKQMIGTHLRAMKFIFRIDIPASCQEYIEIEHSKDYVYS